MTLFLVLLLAFVAISQGIFVPLSHEKVKKEFRVFKLKYNKKYATEEEERFRFEIFKENINAIKKHNEEYENGQHTYSKIVNQLADLREEEWVSYFGGSHLNPETKVFTNDLPIFSTTLDPEELPVNIDWQELGYVTGPKNQGGCGACAYFSGMRALEASYKRKTGELEDLSVQQIIDCGKGSGCHGSWPEWSLVYAQQAGGLEKDSDYPYVGNKQKCNANKTKTLGPVLDHYKLVDRFNVQAMKEAIATQGPITAGICARGFAISDQGIFYDESLRGCYPNHAVAIVGYGRLEDYVDGPVKDYWLMKNSWGENGNYKIAMGVNMLDIEHDCYLPIVDGFVPDWMQNSTITSV